MLSIKEFLQDIGKVCKVELKFIDERSYFLIRVSEFWKYIPVQIDDKTIDIQSLENSVLDLISEILNLREDWKDIERITSFLNICAKYNLLTSHTTYTINKTL